MKVLDHPEFKPGDEVERIFPIAPHHNTKYDKNKGRVISVYIAPVSGLLVRIDHGGSAKSTYSLSHWKKKPKTK